MREHGYVGRHRRNGPAAKRGNDGAKATSDGTGAETAARAEAAVADEPGHRGHLNDSPSEL